jgi:hypothetical protein
MHAARIFQSGTSGKRSAPMGKAGKPDILKKAPITPLISTPHPTPKFGFAMSACGGMVCG